MTAPDAPTPEPPLAPRRPALPEGFDSFLLRIGRLNYAWTNTESLLIHLIAGLVPTDKDTATLLHLSLNTTRARLDLVDRLSRRDGCPLSAEATARILAASGQMRKLSGLRNRLNHALYAFDPEGGPARAIQMQIAERRGSLQIGAETRLDAATLAELDRALGALLALNAEVWAIVADHGLPP